MATMKGWRSRLNQRWRVVGSSRRAGLLVGFMLLVSGLLAGCEGAVVFAPTPLPPDLSPLRYTHPSGAFTVSIPRNWSIYEQNTPTLASATFAPADQGEPYVSFAVIKVREAVDAGDFGSVMEQYQTLHRPDLNHYTAQDRQAMGDGSWRLTGYRTLPGGLPQAVNTFIEYSGALVAVTDVVMPRDAGLQTALQTAINTFRLNPETALQPTELATLALVRRAPLEVQNVAAWTSAAGVLFVTGEVGNFSDAPVADVPVRVTLLNSDGSTVLEAVDVVMGYGIAPGGFAPFSLRFGEGQPESSTSFRVALGGADWSPTDTPRLFYGAGTLTWTDESQFADDGALLITGTVTNRGTVGLRDLLGIVTVFDRQQQVIGAWFAPLAVDALAAGADAPFEIRVPEVGGDPVNYILDIQGVAGE